MDMKQRYCKACGKNFVFYPSASKGIYCSYKCYWVSKKGIYPTHTGQEIKPFPRCMDCQIELHHKNRTTKRCINCRVKYLNAKSGFTGVMPRCLDCKKHLTSRYVKRCSACFHQQNKGKQHPNWKGGMGTERHKLMGQKEYILWRVAVFMRDDYTCQLCHIKGGELNADHIKPWALYPELRYAIDNGRTLCVTCHRQTDTWGGKPMYREVGA